MDLLKELLAYYNIDEHTYKSLSTKYTLDNFNDGHEFDNGLETASFLFEQMNQHKKIIIYGDYDADGILGISILKKMFMYLSYDVDYYAPSRYIDGYGITVERAKEYVDKHYDLVITVDNGISAFEAIDYLRKNNINVIIIDHHTPDTVLPNANYILHPSISHLGDTATSGAFSAFIFSRYVLKRVDKYLATLAAVSIITDVMPLVSYNHNLIKTVIDGYLNNEFLSISLLLGDGIFNVESMGLRIGPRINSIGRVVEDTSINDLVKFFVCDDKEYLLNYIEHIEEVNEYRKQLTNVNLEEANIDKTKSGIVYRTNAKEGIIGLYASNIVKQLNRPTIVFSESKDKGILKGSARSVPPFKIDEAFSQLKDILVAGGGHPQAGGCSIKEEDYEEFCRRFDDLASKYDYSNKNNKYIDITLSDINRDNAKIVESFGPFGREWEAPNLKLSHIKTSTLLFSKTGEHIMSYVSKNSKIVGWRLPKEFVLKFQYIDMYGSLSNGVYKGFPETNFTVKDIEESK